MLLRRSTESSQTFLGLISNDLHPPSFHKAKCAYQHPRLLSKKIYQLLELPNIDSIIGAVARIAASIIVPTFGHPDTFTMGTHKEPQCQVALSVSSSSSALGYQPVRSGRFHQMRTN